MMRLASLSALALLAACGTAPAPGNDAETADNATQAANMAQVDPAPDPVPDAAADSDKPLVNLAPGALSLVDPASGRAREVAFGTAAADVIAIATAALGAPTRSGTNRECGAGAMDYARFGGLTLWAIDGKFTGWFVDDGKTGLSTAAGVGIGSPAKAVTDAYAVKVEESTLGLEFGTDDGNFGGLLTGPGPQGKVEAMWSGQVCQFR